MPSADEENRQYFHEAYRTGQHGWGATEPSPYAVKSLERVQALVPGGKLLDLGCGEGRHALAAARLGFRVTGVDFEPLALDRARRAAKAAGVSGVTFRRADVLALSFAPASFDVVLDFGCLHSQTKAHQPAYWASLLKVLRPGGFYILTAFSPEFRLFRGRKRSWQIAYGGYRRYFTREDLEQLWGKDFACLELLGQRGPEGGFWHVLLQRKTRE